MSSIAECIYRCKRTLECLEKDQININQCIDGDIKEVYVNLVLKEQIAIKEIIADLSLIYEILSV